MKKKTVVLGASPNPARYSYAAAEMLTEAGHEMVPVGMRKGSIFGREILDIRQRPDIARVDTVTLYVGPVNQDGFLDYIARLKPARVIFNPGTENPELEAQLRKKGIGTIQACTLVMLRTGQY